MVDMSDRSLGLANNGDRVAPDASTQALEEVAEAEGVRSVPELIA